MLQQILMLKRFSIQYITHFSAYGETLGRDTVSLSLCLLLIYFVRDKSFRTCDDNIYPESSPATPSPPPSPFLDIISNVWCSVQLVDMIRSHDFLGCAGFCRYALWLLRVIETPWPGYSLGSLLCYRNAMARVPFRLPSAIQRRHGPGTL
jgi:hypothetical protein